MTPTTLWLIAGVAFFAAEALGATGIGLLFAGFGAIITGIVLSIGLLAEDATIAQFVMFFAATAAVAVVLWKPLQKFRVRRAGGGYNNMVGDTVYIAAAGIKKGQTGEATWSGTIMKAELAEGASDLPGGAQAIITDVRGATLIVKPKN